MPRSQKNNGVRLLPWLNAAAYALMLAFNALAELLPLNGVKTGEVSAFYPSLFAPADISFSIWGLIYLLLLLFTLCQLGLFKRFADDGAAAARRIGPFFILSSLFNAAWLFCWHYFRIPLSALCMLLLFLSLALIYVRVNGLRLSIGAYWLLKLPFSVYFAWISVALIVNISAALLSVGWNGFGLSETFWTLVMLIIGTLIGLSVVASKRDAAYGLTMSWAYLGIFIKHMSDKGFNGAYPAVMWTSAACAAVLLSASALTALRRLKK